MLAAPGNTGWLLGVMGPVFGFAAIAPTQSGGAGIPGVTLAFATFYGCILSENPPSRAAISFALMAFSLFAQVGLGVASQQLPVLKAAPAPRNSRACRTAHDHAVRIGRAHWPRDSLVKTGRNTRDGHHHHWHPTRTVVVQSGEIVRLVGVLSAITAGTPLIEGFTSVVAEVLFDFFARTKLRHVTQMEVLNKIEYAPSAEYGLLLQLKNKFGHAPIVVAVPYLALMAAVGDESAR
jgi:hypothetical protein